MLLKLIRLTGSNLNDKEKTLTTVDYVKKRETDRSTLYSFDGPFQLINTDVGNLEFLGKNPTVPKYVLLLVDLFSSKVYVYPMHSRKLILQKMKLFYNEVQEKIKNKPMRLQVDNEFLQLKIQVLNNQNNVEMFTTSVRGGKAFSAEQKIRELKTRVAKLNIQKLKISPIKIILKSAANMNNVITEKCGLSSEEIETRLLSDEKFKTLFNFYRVERTIQVHERLNRYD